MTTVGYGAVLVGIGALVVALMTIDVPWVVEARSSTAVCRIFRVVGQDCTADERDKPGQGPGFLAQYAHNC